MNALKQTLLIALIFIGAHAWAADNDVFAAGRVISGLVVRTSGDNYDCTAETGEPAHAGSAASASVWWVWTAPTSTWVTVNTLGSDFDTVLAVYTGNALGSLTEVASSDDYYAECLQSLVEFDATAGVTYRIAVDGKYGAQGEIALTVRADSLASSNETFATRTTLAGLPTSVSASNTMAVGQAGVPSVGGFGGLTPQSALWWSWTAAASCVMEADTRGSTFDTVLGVYTGSVYGALSEMAFNDDRGTSKQARVWFDAQAGVAYQLVVDGKYGQTGQLVLNLREVVPPEIEALTVTNPATAQLRWSSVAGDNYRLLVSSNLTAWAAVTNVSALSATTTVTAAGGVPASQFYKVERFLEE